ncbi:MAG: HD domain-containing protein [Nanoarchaeota archaeon]|nr:HD domain-containing protein [Nanoarchaeota archaeon]
MKNQPIIIKDPLYKQIFVERKFKKILDCKEFQRLRYIKQVSFVDYVYPSANHTRFSHSLGAFHLMKRVVNNGLMKIPPESKDNLILAAMLHDIGHGPFSHLWEKIFPHFNHEKTTQEILRNKNLHDVADILAKKSPYSQLISSTIDVDKLDYMARDSYFTGVSYGVAEVGFIIQHMFVEKEKLIIMPSALSSVEDLITQRVNLFKTVYFHKFAMEYDMIFIKIFKRINEIIKKGIEVPMDQHLLTFFKKENTTNDLLALNDAIILSHIHQWSKHDDEILSDLASIFILRKKFKAVNRAHKKTNIEKIKKETAKKYNIKYYFEHIKLPINIIQTPIYIEHFDKIKKLEEVSDLIAFYKKQKWSVDYVIYPRDIKI